MSKKITHLMLPAALLLGVLSLAFAQPAADDKDKDKDKDKKALQGRWKSETEPKILLVLEGDKMTTSDTTGGMELGTATVTLDPKKSPKTIDFKVLTGGDMGKTFLGIYELKDDDLKLMVGEPDGPRPASFDKGKGGTLLVLKRQAKNAK